MWIVIPEILWQPPQQKYKFFFFLKKLPLILITGMGFPLFPTFPILVHLFMDSYYFLPLKFKITSNNYCSHKIKRLLLLGRKAVTNLDSVLKSRDITLPTKVHLLKAIVFPVAMYGCESWTVKKAKHQRIDAFELWCWRKLLRVPWTKRRSNHSILKEINPEYSLEELMLKLQYFGHLMQRTDSLEKTLILGKIEGKRRRGRQRMRCLDSITSSKDMNLSKFQATVKDRGAWRAAVRGAAMSRTWLSNWTTTKIQTFSRLMSKVSFLLSMFCLENCTHVCSFISLQCLQVSISSSKPFLAIMRLSLVLLGV